MGRAGHHLVVERPFAVAAARDREIDRPAADPAAHAAPLRMPCVVAAQAVIQPTGRPSSLRNTAAPSSCHPLPCFSRRQASWPGRSSRRQNMEATICMGVMMSSMTLAHQHLCRTVQNRCRDRPIRRIAHLDMDAFYASVELLRYPQLKGLPVVIGGGRRKVDEAIRDLPEGGMLADIPVEAFPLLKDYAGRGVITTATYPARQFGVGSAMGLMKAAKLCPQAHRSCRSISTRYRKYSRRFKQVITEIAPVMEDRGVDEVYIDFTDVPGGQREGGRVLARLIQQLDLRRHRADLLDRRRAQQAAGQDGERVRQAQRHLRRVRERSADAHLAAALPQGQRHRAQGRREAAALRHPHHRRTRGAASATGSSRTSARPPAPGCTRWPGAATSGRW